MYHKVVNSAGIQAGPPRVYLKYMWQPGLATSRSFGDSMAKMVGVTVEPDFNIHFFEEGDEIIIVASDGLWEVMSSEASPATCLVQELIISEIPKRGRIYSARCLSSHDTTRAH